MKKYTILAVVLALTGCNAYHNGKIGMTISNPDLEFIPMQASVNVDTTSKLTGSAECTSRFWIFNNAPERQTYGTKLQTSAGNFASGQCVAAAVYDAMSKSTADVFVAPQYTAIRKGILCFGDKCFAGKTKVLVSGYAGKISSITNMDSTVVHEKQKGAKSEAGVSSLLGGLL